MAGQFGFLAALLVLVSGAPAMAQTVTVKANNVHEECFDMVAGQPLSYEFSAPIPLDFNVHYHEGPQVHYLAQLESEFSGKGEITVPVAQHYCLMWTNEGWQDADLQYSYKIAGETVPEGMEEKAD